MKSLAIGLALGLGIAIIAQQTTVSGQVRGGGSATASSSAHGQGGGSATGSGSGSGTARTITMPTHAIIWEPGESWVPGRPLEEQPGFTAHVRYLLQFVKSGQNLLSGPWRDEPGGLTILSVRTDELANQIAFEDPAVKSGLFVPKVMAWKVVMGSISPRSQVSVGRSGGR